MRKMVLTTFSGVFTLFITTGCGLTQPKVFVEEKAPQKLYIENVKLYTASNYDKTPELQNSCSMHLYLYTAAKETLARGYRYFALTDPGYGMKYDNNMLGLPIISPEAYERYCNPALKEPDTGLEDDKCLYRNRFRDITTIYKGNIAMFKKRNYLFPTWDAAETLKQEEQKLNSCVDWSAYKNASSAKDINVKKI